MEDVFCFDFIAQIEERRWTWFSWYLIIHTEANKKSVIQLSDGKGGFAGCKRFSSTMSNNKCSKARNI